MSVIEPPDDDLSSAPALITVGDQRLIDAGSSIYSNTPTGDDMAFTHAVFCQVGLPRSKVKSREFMRRSGAAWVNVQAGFLDEGKGPVEQPIPYGALPRLALAHVGTYAVRNKTREIPIGDSAAEFLQWMGMGDDGRRYASLRSQINALAACRMQIGYKGRTFSGQAVEQFDAWLTNKDTGQASFWPGRMVLSEHFYSSLIDGAVPMDIRALHALKGSSLAIDVYAWLAHRLHRIEGRGVLLHWHALREQFGSEYNGPEADKNFKKEFSQVLKRVLTVYPQANVKKVPGGLVLMGSPPPIPLK